MPPRGWWTDLRISDVGFGSKADMIVKRGLNPTRAHQREARLDAPEQAVAHRAVGIQNLLAAAVGQRRGLVSLHCYGFETVAATAKKLASG